MQLYPTPTPTISIVIVTTLLKTDLRADTDYDGLNRLGLSERLMTEHYTLIRSVLLDIIVLLHGLTISADWTCRLMLIENITKFHNLIKIEVWLISSNIYYSIVTNSSSIIALRK